MRAREYVRACVGLCMCVCDNFLTQFGIVYAPDVTTALHMQMAFAGETKSRLFYHRKIWTASLVSICRVSMSINVFEHALVPAYWAPNWLQGFPNNA